MFEIFFIGGNPVSSSSRKQQTVSLSSGEAEYISLSAAIQEAMWLRSMLTELGFKPKKRPRSGSTTRVRSQLQRTLSCIQGQSISTFDTTSSETA